MIRNLFSKLADVVCFRLNTWAHSLMQYTCKHESTFCMWLDEPVRGKVRTSYVCTSCGKVIFDYVHD